MKLLLPILFVIFFCSCKNNNQQQISIDKDTVTSAQQSNIGQQQSVTYTDSIEAFFHSKGVLVFIPSDKNLNKSFTLLNNDGSVYAQVNIGADEVLINGKKHNLSNFTNDQNLRQEYNFFPKEFYPDHTVFQFEYLSVKNDLAEVLINKEKNVRKYIKVDKSMFKVETWKRHLVGTMIDFDVKTNPIRVSKSEQSKSVGFESSGNDYIFVITEIAGDWIKVECSDICENPCDDGKKYDGWIKWKDNNKLLIRLLYAC